MPDQEASSASTGGAVVNLTPEQLQQIIQSAVGAAMAALPRPGPPVVAPVPVAPVARERYKISTDSIPLLNAGGSNYRKWAGGVKRVLEAHPSKLFPILEGGETLAGAADSVARELFKERNANLVTFLLASMGAERKELHNREESAQVLWDNMKAYCSSYTPESAAMLGQKLTLRKFEPEKESVEVFWSDWTDMYYELDGLQYLQHANGLDVFLPLANLLAGLPESFDEVRKEGLKLAMPWNKATLNAVFQLLMAQENRLKAKDDAEVLRAYAVHAGPRNNSKGNNNSNKGKGPANPNRCTCEKATKVPHDKDKCVGKAFADFATRYPGKPNPGAFYDMSRVQRGKNVAQCLDEFQDPVAKAAGVDDADEEIVANMITFAYSGSLVGENTEGEEGEFFYAPEAADMDDFFDAPEHADPKFHDALEISREAVPLDDLEEGTVRWWEEDVPEEDQVPTIGIRACAAVLRPTTAPRSSKTFVADSGSTHHMAQNLALFHSYTPYPSPRTVRGATKGMETVALGYGEVRLHFPTHVLHLGHVLYVPSLHDNLLSIPLLDKAGCNINFGDETCTIRNTDKVLVATGPLEQGLYYFHVLTPQARVATPYPTFTVADLWHLRLGHLSQPLLQNMVSGEMASGLPTTLPPSGSDICRACIHGKSKRAPFPSSSTRASAPGEVIFVDICGDISPPAQGGIQHFLVLVDDFSRFGKVHLLKNRREAPEKVREFITHIKVQKGYVVKGMRTDGAKEWLSDTMKAFCSREGLRHELTTPYTSSQNGAVERRIGVLTEMAICLLAWGHLSHTWWGHAVLHANYLYNVRATTTLKGMTPFEAFMGSKPDVARLRVFECIGYVLVQAK